jgi:hypothetical protein
VKQKSKLRWLRIDVGEKVLEYYDMKFLSWQFIIEKFSFSNKCRFFILHYFLTVFKAFLKFLCFRSIYKIMKKLLQNFKLSSWEFFSLFAFKSILFKVPLTTISKYNKTCLGRFQDCGRGKGKNM